MNKHVTYGKGLHLTRYWMQTQQVKKMGEGNISIHLPSTTWNQAVMAVVKVATADVQDEKVWERKVDKALKNIVVQDLGDLDATMLIMALQESTSGLSDLQALEKELGVVVLFCTLSSSETSSETSSQTDQPNPERSSSSSSSSQETTREKKKNNNQQFYTSEHVYLIGLQKKLDKKSGDIRNLLTHYHWRMSGRDLSFEEMTAKK